MENKYRLVYRELLDLSDDDPTAVDLLINQFKDNVTEKFEEVHKKLEIQKEKLIKVALESYRIKKLEEEESLANRKNEKTGESLGIQERISKLQQILSKLKNRNDFLDRVIDEFSKKKISELLKIENNEFKIQMMDKLKVKKKKKNINKSSVEVIFNTNLNEKIQSAIFDTIKELTVMNTGMCMQIYDLQPELETENLMIQFITNVIAEPNQFYFGIMNEEYDPNAFDNCNFCTSNSLLSSLVYFDCNGMMHDKDQNPVEIKKLSFKEEPESIITIRLSLERESKVFFSVNESGEHGPYSLNGERFRIFIATCGNAHGKISILTSEMI